MADSIEVIIAKAMVAAIESAKTDGDGDGNDLEFVDFIGDYEFGQRFEFQQQRTTDFPEEWLLKDDRLHVRVIVPEKPDSIYRYDRESLAWVTHLDIDIRTKLGDDERQSDGSISREHLSRLCRFTEQLFRITGYDLTEARIDVTGEGTDAEWIDGGRKDVQPVSEIMFKYMAAALRRNQFYSSIRQVFQVTR